jgi:hypothetical protein
MVLPCIFVSMTAVRVKNFIPYCHSMYLEGLRKITKALRLACLWPPDYKSVLPLARSGDIFKYGVSLSISSSRTNAHGFLCTSP